MKKIYCVILIDPITKEIAHCATSDSPIPDNLMPTAEDELGVLINYGVEKYEFENNEDKMIRAREIIDSMEKVGNAPLTLKAGMEAKANRFTGLKKI